MEEKGVKYNILFLTQREPNAQRYEIFLSNFNLHTVIRPAKGSKQNITVMSYKGLFTWGN